MQWAAASVGCYLGFPCSTVSAIHSWQAASAACRVATMPERHNSTSQPLQMRPAHMCTSEVEQRWQANYVFRSRILGLHLFTSTLSAAANILPRLHSGCPATLDTPLIIAGLVGLPVLEWLVNFDCHRRMVSSERAKRMLAPLLTVYYVAIVLYDICTHIMDYSHDRTAKPAVEIASASCPTVLHMMPNHSAMLEQTVDLTFHFFVVSCMLERESSRCVLVLSHFALWTIDNLTYDIYNPGGAWDHQVSRQLHAPTAWTIP